MAGSILVTGAAGFVGGHLLDHLHREAGPLVGWRRPVGPPARELAGVQWMDVELLDRDDVRRALAETRPAAIYHMAGAAHVAQSWRHPLETYEGNVRATHHLFAALRDLELTPRVLIPSSAHVYAPQPRPIREDDELKTSSPYATSKIAQEILARRVWEDEGLPTVIARAFNHFGPRQDPTFVTSSIARQIALIEAGKSDPVLRMGNLEAQRDLTDVRDTVRAYVAMIDRGRPGTVYNVASGRAIAVGDLVRTLVGRAARDIRIEQDPAFFRPNDIPLLVGDRTRLFTDTGWQPEIPLEQTVDDLLEYWRTRVNAEA